MIKTRKSPLALACLALFINSCAAPKTKEQVTKSYKIMTTKLSSSSVVNRYSATLRAAEYVDIRPQVSGTITDICIEEGDEVKRGEILFVIDRAPYLAAAQIAKANVESAKAKLASAELNRRSGEGLLSKSIISENEQQITINAESAARAALTLAMAQLQSAENELSYTEVKSPIDGIASMIPYRVGALVGSSIGEPLVSVANNDKVYAYFSLAETQVLSLIRQSGTSEGLLEQMPALDLILSDGVSYTHSGKVDAISGTVDRSTGAVSLRATFLNTEHMLRDGGSGSVVITTQRDGVVVIPKRATFELQNKIFVYKIIDGKASSSQIGVYPLDNGTEYIVESGLKAGERIIAEGAGLMREGTVVETTK